MSALKTVIRDLKDAVLKGLAHTKEKLPRLADNLSDNFDTMRHGVRDVDVFDATTTRGRNSKTTTVDRFTGRPVSERGHVEEDFGSSTRGDNATQIGRLGNDGDHGGHLGAHRFFGDTPDGGIVPQAGNLNLGAWKTMENEWADFTGAGYHVDYTVDVSPPGAVRPDNFEVSYTVTDPDTGGVVYDNWQSFQNEAGQSFDRIPRGDIPPR